MKKETLKALLEARAMRRAAVLVTPLDGGGQELVSEGEIEQGHPLAGELRTCFSSGRGKVVETKAGELFVQAFLPVPRLMIIGATHIAQVLVRLAREVEIEPFVIDPRTAFATQGRFGDAEIITEWPQDALDRLGLDRRCGVVCLAHVPDIDDEALVAALLGECFYIGALGSRRSHARRLERLKDKGCEDVGLSRIHGPVGLDIGALGPGEIALSIIAEVVKTMRLQNGD